MPLTPLHFGPGLLIKSIYLESFSFKVFVLANIFIDLEPLYYLATNQWPLHRFFHTYLGATLIAIATTLLGIFFFKKISKKSIITGAFIGTYSHIFLDSMMHVDLKPFYPFSTVNSFLHVLSSFQLQLMCVLMGLLGGLIYFIKTRKFNK